MYEVFQELNKFNNVTFHEKPHTYYIDGKKLDSTTGIISQFYSEFNEAYWSVYSSAKENKYEPKYNKNFPDKVGFKIDNQADYTYFYFKDVPEKYLKPITPNNLIDTWAYKKNHACYEGSVVHNFIENYYSNKIVEPPREMFNIPFSDIKNSVKIMLTYFLDFAKKSKPWLIPIKSELVIGDLSILLGGMVDQLFYNLYAKELQIWDWKTNTKFTTKDNFNRLKGIFSKYDECNLSEYSIQLNIYKALIERVTNLKIGSCYLVHFNECNPTYHIYKAYDMQEEVKQLFLEREKIPLS